MPREVFVAGQVLTAAELNVVSDQSVMVFAGTAARGSAIPSPTEGMVTYLEDSDAVQVYTTDWEDVGVAPAILQVVSTAKTDTFSSSSTSFTDITGLTATITPSSASSKILVMVSLNASIPSTLTNGGQLRITRDAIDILLGDAASSRTRATFGNIVTTSGHAAHNYAMNYLDSPATTSALTYGVELRMVSAHSGNINRSSTDNNAADYARTASTITVMEVAG